MVASSASGRLATPQKDHLATLQNGRYNTFDDEAEAGHGGRQR